MRMTDHGLHESSSKRESQSSSIQIYIIIGVIHGNAYWIGRMVLCNVVASVCAPGEAFVWIFMHNVLYDYMIYLRRSVS